MCKGRHGKKIEQVLPTIQVLFLILQKCCRSYCPTKKSHAEPKGEKTISCQNGKSFADVVDFGTS